MGKTNVEDVMVELTNKLAALPPDAPQDVVREVAAKLASLQLARQRDPADAALAFACMAYEVMLKVVKCVAIGAAKNAQAKRARKGA